MLTWTPPLHLPITHPPIPCVGGLCCPAQGFKRMDLPRLGRKRAGRALGNSPPRARSLYLLADDLSPPHTYI